MVLRRRRNIVFETVFPAMQQEKTPTAPRFNSRISTLDDFTWSTI